MYRHFDTTPAPKAERSYKDHRLDDDFFTDEQLLRQERELTLRGDEKLPEDETFITKLRRWWHSR